MEINNELLDYLSRLSRIEVKEGQKEKLKKDLSDIVTWMEKLQELDTEGVEPLTTMSRTTNDVREDKEGQHLDRAEALSLAPKKNDEFFLVPKVKK